MTAEALPTGNLWDALKSVPDHRRAEGKRYPLASLLLIAIAAMLAGRRDQLGIVRWGRRLSQDALAAIGISRARVPAPSVWCELFQSLDVAALEQALGRWVAGEAPAGPVAIDGKRLRGSQSANSPGIHVLQAFSTGLQASIGALAVPPDSAEVVEAIALLKDLPIGAGDVVTGDAAFTYRSIIEAIRAKGAGYFLFVKANQPELQAEIAHAFGDDSPCTGGRAARCPEPAGRSA